MGRRVAPVDLGLKCEGYGSVLPLGQKGQQFVFDSSPRAGPLPGEGEGEGGGRESECECVSVLGHLRTIMGSQYLRGPGDCMSQACALIGGRQDPPFGYTHPDLEGW